MEAEGGQCDNSPVCEEGGAGDGDEPVEDDVACTYKDRLDQLLVSQNCRFGSRVNSLLSPMYVHSRATTAVIANAHLGRPLASTFAIY